jgi:signal transduction histidine kinase
VTAELELPLGKPPAPAQVVLAPLPGLDRPAVSVRIGLHGQPSPQPLQTERHDTWHDLARIFRRFPHGVVAVWPDLRIAFANSFGRHLLAGQAPLLGTRLTATPNGRELHALAERLMRLQVPFAPASIELGDRSIRVTGIPGLQGEPSFLLLEDVTRERQRERVTSDFLRNAAHQLRTPVAAITAALDALDAGAKHDPADRDRFLGHIGQHAARMTRLAHALLVLARAHAGEQALRLDFVELGPLLDRLTARAAPRDGVRIETQCSPGIAALAEPDLVEETLAALLDNAVAHTAQGTIRLTATEVDWQALIAVEDSGDGILPEHRTRVFEPFFQVWQANGFGLGLAIARQAVEAMDGQIEVNDAPGGGTQFVIRLPSARVLAASPSGA